MAKKVENMDLFVEQKHDYENRFKFFYKNKKREIVPVEDEDINKQAEQRLSFILKNYKDKLPKRFLDNWDIVKLYNPKGNVEKAKSLIIHVEDGAFDIENKLNHMTGKEWTIFTCSWFIFNALPSDLKQEKQLLMGVEEHPATFSPSMISNFVEFFTKEGAKVIDPFAGIGSTLEACKRTGRIGYGIELNKKYFDIIKHRLPEFKNNIFNDDCRNIDKLGLPSFDFSISSPPYWDVLNRSTDGFKRDREEKGLDVNYSDSLLDLGNIDDYDVFLREVCSVYLKLYDLMNDGAYICIIVKNIKKNGKMYPLAWDIARELGKKYVLKDEKLWIQDEIGLSPYGYPFTWASNILHHYCIILRKE